MPSFLFSLPSESLNSFHLQKSVLDKNKEINIAFFRPRIFHDQLSSPSTQLCSNIMLTGDINTYCCDHWYYFICGISVNIFLKKKNEKEIVYRIKIISYGYILYTLWYKVTSSAKYSYMYVMLWLPISYLNRTVNYLFDCFKSTNRKHVTQI